MHKLEQLEQETGRTHTVDHANRVCEKAAENPASLTDEDLLVIDFFRGGKAATEARAARERALRPTVEPASPPVTATPPALSIAYPKDLDVLADAEQLKSWSLENAAKAVPVGVWWLLVTKGRQYREELESKVDALEARQAELGPLAANVVAHRLDVYKLLVSRKEAAERIDFLEKRIAALEARDKP